jgi:hypothetical protein
MKRLLRAVCKLLVVSIEEFAIREPNVTARISRQKETVVKRIFNRTAAEAFTARASAAFCLVNR